MVSATQAPDDAPEDGRMASRPSGFPARAWKSVLYRVWTGLGRHHLSVVSAGVAFFALLAIFPAIAALISLYGLVADPTQIIESMDAVRPILPPDVYAMISDQVQQLLAAGRSSLGFASLISLALTIWAARAGVTGLMEGLNVVYREVDERNIVVQYLISFALTLMLMLVSIIAVVAVVAVPAILHFSDLGALGTLAAQATPLVILGFAMVLVVGVLYRYGPHRSFARKRWVSLGAIVATALWVLVSLLLSVYLSRFGDFNETYGSIGAIAGLMFWLYASAYVVLLGAELNASMELQTSRDTTTGRPKPMGERGAYVADNVA